MRKMSSFLREQLFRGFPTWNTILLNNLTHLFDWWEVKLWRVGPLSEVNFERILFKKYIQNEFKLNLFYIENWNWIVGGEGPRVPLSEANFVARTACQLTTSWWRWWWWMMMVDDDGGIISNLWYHILWYTTSSPHWWWRMYYFLEGIDAFIYHSFM